jgi:hypothetical protein
MRMELESRGARILMTNHAPSIAFLSEFCRPLASIWLDMQTVSEANIASHAHWKERHARAKSQINHTIFSMRAKLREWEHVRLPLHIVLERHSTTARELDDDNLAASIKHVRDGVADALGLYLPAGKGPRRMSKKSNAHFDDNDRLRWSYRAVNCASKEGVAIRIYKQGEMGCAIAELIAARGADAFLALVAQHSAELDKVLP